MANRKFEINNQGVKVENNSEIRGMLIKWFPSWEGPGVGNTLKNPPPTPPGRGA
ncbi:MAG: hypothetical protein IPN68_13090 [Bacteroidetes bacterium]|nr:hypothetical protein [Bacteroidota bacterium]